MSRKGPTESRSSRTGVLCAGALVLDTLVSPFNSLRWGTTTFVDSIEPRVGGSAANTARALSKLGVPVRVAASLGSDEVANVIRQEMTRYKVDISAIVDANEPSPQTVVLVNSDGDRQFLHLKGCSEIAFRGGLDFTSELIAGMRHFHLASLFVVPHLRTQAPSMLRNARTAGLTTSLDTCWDPQGEWMQVLAPCLPELDILFMNEDEMGQICAGRTIVDASREMISMGAAMVVMKNGQRGCLVRTQDGEIICPAYDVLARDTTGAGDCFVAGFLAAHLRGATPDCAGLMGNAAGGLSVQHIGAVEGLLSRADLEEWMSRTKLRSLQT